MEYTMIKAAMDKFSGNLSLVANQLGISRQTLYNKIKRYELKGIYYSLTFRLALAIGLTAALTYQPWRKNGGGSCS